MTYIEVYCPPLHAVAASCLLYIQAVERCYYLVQENSLRCRQRFIVWVYWEVAVYPDNNFTSILQHVSSPKDRGKVAAPSRSDFYGVDVIESWAAARCGAEMDPFPSRR